MQLEHAPGTRHVSTRLLALAALVCALVALVAPRIARAGTVVVDAEVSAVPLGRALDLAYDEAGTCDAEAVIGGALPWEPSRREVPSFGYRPGVAWARVRVEDRRGAGADALILDHGAGQTDVVELYEVREGEPVRRRVAGDQVPVESWEIEGRTPAFRIAPGSVTLYLAVRGVSSKYLAFTLRSPSDFDAHRTKEERIYAFYFGILAALAVYNAVVAIQTRLAAYAYYVGYLVGFLVFYLGFVGHLTALGLPFPGVINWLSVYSVLVSLSCAVGFTIALLGIPRGTRWFAVLTRPLSLIWVLAFALLPLGYRALALVGSAYILVVIVSLLAVGVAYARRGSRPARVFVVAWAAFLAGSALMVLRQVGLVPSTPLTTYAQPIGSTVEVILLSFALSDRIRQLQEETTILARKAQEAAAHALAEQRRVNAELTRLDALKDAFLANTSHELRTPLHAMLGLTEAVLEGDHHLAAESRERLGFVVSAGRRLGTLVNDILDLAKLRHSGLTLQRGPVPVAEAVGHAVAVMAPLASAAGLDLVTDVPADLTVEADSARLQQVLVNLVGNAIKFTERGHVRVAARAEGERVCVSVEDTGIGIAKEHEDRIFGPFVQLDASATREQGGTGLGLALTRKLVELHGGELRVRSKLGEGSVFTFDLPRIAAPPADADDGARSGPLAVPPADAPGEAHRGPLDGHV